MTAAAATRPTRLSRAGVLAGATLPGLIVTFLSAVAAWLLRDELSALNVLVGGLLALAIFALGILALRGIMSGETRATMVGAFGVLALQLVLLATAMTLLRAQDWVRMTDLVVGFLVAGLFFLAGLVWTTSRARVGLDVRMPGGRA